MIVKIVAVDKMRAPYLRDGCATYVRRLGRLLPTTTYEVKPAGAADEARAILRLVPAHAQLWALEREGKTLSSVDLARKIAALQRNGQKLLVMAIGGADGLPQPVIERADFSWSLSSLTFLHEMARLLALEQLFRAMKIIRGEPYHR